MLLTCYGCRQVLPQYVQRRLYSFLKHSFEKWPLDASFRQVLDIITPLFSKSFSNFVEFHTNLCHVTFDPQMLETWLSYIQPWRYTDPLQSNRDRQEDTRDRVIDEKWRPFVMDNLLFYTNLFQMSLYRALRMDLSSPKNAYMLFRISKVRIKYGRKLLKCVRLNDTSISADGSYVHHIFQVFNLPALRDMIDDG